MSLILFIQRFLFVVLLTIPLVSSADEMTPKQQFEIGKQKALVCITCHGVDGISATGTYPNLQGQKQQYLVAALKAYKQNQRVDGLAILMQGYAKDLSDQDMKDLAYYFSTVKTDTSHQSQ
ncbi:MULTISPECIES: cytochrome c [unclassified Photobacterium]|uniref:c-type cytochrome n=1 Tax=unclassified Photobacterium TaxID=2628852 RepID=UPI001EDF1E0A|nr:MULTISPECIES: cytochrome c [unclassified Photobacterium]MCG3863330.1 cytochrome c [Photobacterium sp. Ph6]MCG3874860.1 cytochrome c [Photobacterium sp. Ph5]